MEPHIPAFDRKPGEHRARHFRADGPRKSISSAKGARGGKPRIASAPGDRAPGATATSLPPFGSTPEPPVCGGQERIKCLAIKKKSGFPGWVAKSGLPGCRLGVHGLPVRPGLQGTRDFVQIEMTSVDRLIPYIRNARTHPADQIAQIAASIAEFGFVNPILVGEDNVIVAGHGRLIAAQSLGLAEVPVIVLDHLSEAQRRALVLADNRIPEGARWDQEMLAAELAWLRDEGFDLEVTGFSDLEIDQLFEGLDIEGLEAGESEGESGRVVSDPEGGGAAVPSAGGAASPSLAARFGIPPFSILDARKGWWQDRKRAWLDIGIRSELGRGEGDRACPGGSPMPGNGSRKDLVPRGGNPPSLGAVRGNVLTKDREEGPYSRRKEKREAQNG